MDFCCSPTKFRRRLSHYEELATKAQHNEIELAKCIKNQYSFHLANESSPKQQIIIATKCIQDLWRWIHEIGIEAVHKNEDLQTEIKSIESHHHSQQNQWEQFCEELKNEHNDLKNYIQQMQFTLNTMLEENRDLKENNEILTRQYEQTINHLDTERDSMIVCKKKMKEFNEIKEIISNALEENQVVHQHRSYAKISNENADPDTIALLCQIIKNQDQRLIALKNSSHSDEGVCKYNLEISQSEHQHYVPCARDGEESCGEMQQDVYGEYDDDVNKYKFKLHQLLIKHKLIRDSDTEFNLNSSLDLIERVCSDAYKYRRAYISANRQMSKLKQRIGSKRKKIPRKNTYAVSTPKKSKHKERNAHHKRSKSISSMPADSLPMIDPMQILSDMTQDLLSLMKYLQIVQNKNQFNYCIHKIQSLCTSSQDLANDIGSPLLQNAVNMLKSLSRDITQHPNLYKFNNEALHDVINLTKNTISDLYHNNMIRSPARSVVIDRVQNKEEQVLSESFSDIMDDDDGDEEDYDVSDAPFIQRIEGNEHWSNKAAKAVIVFKGKKYKRNMKAFEWLSKVLLLSNCGGNIPKFAQSISRKKWDINKRKRELNRYLKECHHTKWIHDFEAYHKIFFAKSYKEWKILRTRFDRNQTRFDRNVI